MRLGQRETEPETDRARDRQTETGRQRQRETETERGAMVIFAHPSSSTIDVSLLPG